MLKKYLTKKFFLIISSIFIILIICLFPTQKETIKNDSQNVKMEESILYLLDPNNYIGRVSVIVNQKDTEHKANELINYLIVNNPKTSYLKEGFTPTIPSKTKILSLVIENDLIKINFSKDILNITEDKEEQMISSLIYTLTSINKINKISIYVEGNLLKELPNSKKKIPAILDRSYGINSKYDITKINGSTKTTIYYLSKYKDYYYYVPITVVSNENKDKINIIIKELASKKVYETSLISYLKDAKEISYQIKEEDMILNFSSELFNSLNRNNLIETLMYTINLSIKDNYQIKKVIYLIDNSFYKAYYI